MSNRTNSPNMVLTLANSAKPRRPSGVRVACVEDPLTSVADATRWLGDCGYAVTGRDGPLSASELRELRRLRTAVESVADALAQANKDGLPPSVPAGALSVLNEIAAECPVELRLATDLRPYYVVPWDDPVAALAATCVREFAECDPTRVKACARQECGHFFYDTTRNRSTLWHAEVPCGWRMRSARRTAAHG